MEFKNYQVMYNVISEYLPHKWDRVAMYFLCAGNMFVSKFYVDMGEGYVDCYNMGYDRSTLGKIFRSLENILVQERKTLPEGKEWTVFTMFISSSGKFDANYEYQNVSETFLEHQKNWERKNIYN